MNLLPTSKCLSLLNTDDSSNMAEDSNGSETREESMQSSGSGGDDASRSRKGTAPGRIITADTTHVPTSVSDLIEYEWPPNQPQADFYFLQEQLSNLLSIKSFKRKYPNLRRRPVESDERKFLIEKHRLSEVMSEYLINDLTALSADDVHDLLGKEYADIYEEYQRICLARQQERQQLERQAAAAESKAIKMDPTKMNEMRKKAIQDAFEANKELQLRRKTERCFFFDSQTSIIQRPIKKPRFEEESKMSVYPVALNPFQFQEYYKRFTPEELRKLPFNTVIEPADLFPPKREPSPLPIRVSDEELIRQERAIAALEKNRKDLSPPAPDTPRSGQRTSARRAEKNAQRLCTSCRSSEEGDSLVDRLLKCYQCNSFIHARCAELSVEVTRVVLNYNWACTECKICTICKKAHEEESMMFCDSCDRGYHTFCVGLREPPQGTWQCSIYCINAMSTTSSVNTDISTKYQRLAAEFVKLRSQVSVLKTAIVEEQNKSTNLKSELSEKETTLRKFQDENEGLLFRNCQLVKRVELLQKSLDEINKLQATKGKKKQKDANLRLFIDSTDQPTNIPGTSTGTDRRQSFEQEFERQQIMISELETNISAIKDDHKTLTNELNAKIATLEAENQDLVEKLKKAEELQAQRKTSVANDLETPKLNGSVEAQLVQHDFVDEKPKQNGCTNEQLLDTLTTNISNEMCKKDQPVPSQILSNHTMHLFEEANRAKSEWEGTIASLEHELDLMRRWKDGQTSVADSIDPQTKATEKSLNSFYREKIKQLLIDLRFAKGESAYYKDECEALSNGAKILLESKKETTACQNCNSLKELLDDTKNVFEFQVRQLYDQINEQENHLQEQKDQINKLAGGGSTSQTREKSIKQSFRRMVGK
ncbi:PHD finger protein 10 [Aphelenchoides bicaudatus]|nr:PHD finger protein 10 [Aphelenchoides bicaudatus]